MRKEYHQYVNTSELERSLSCERKKARENRSSFSDDDGNIDSLIVLSADPDIEERKKKKRQ